jgi:hypothetical protein
MVIFNLDSGATKPCSVHCESLEPSMSGHFSTYGATGGNGSKVYQCSSCNAVITYSDRLLQIGETYRHLFVNPLGIAFDFYTFTSCPGMLAHGAATEEHTWFPGYQWSFAFCHNCGQHLGWLYTAVSRQTRPGEFWGLLVTHLLAR